MKIALIMASVLIAILALAWIGLQIKPKPFPPYPERTPELEMVSLPPGLPAPVERFYRAVYGEKVPVIKSVVITGRGTIQPVLAGPKLPARFIFVHNTGKDYRHYFESTIYNLPFLKVNEGIIDGKSFFESPMGTYHDDPNTNQGANLALWAEATWFPAILVTDSRVRWEPVDADTALLYVPYEDQEENFVVRFSPETGMVEMMEAMRYRNPGDKAKILWMPHSLQGPKLPGTNIDSSGAAMWLDHGKPWATFTLEDIVYNVDVSKYILQRGK